jgi:hypothetical protein
VWETQSRRGRRGGGERGRKRKEGEGTEILRKGIEKGGGMQG